MWFWGIVFLTLVVLPVVVLQRARAQDDKLWSIAERALVCAALGWAVGVTIYLAAWRWSVRFSYWFSS